MPFLLNLPVNISLYSHIYLALNIVLMIFYPLTRLILQSGYFNHGISQYQQLNFVRYAFLMTIILCFIIPAVISAMPMLAHTHFRLDPLLKSASSVFLEHHQIIHQQITKIQSSLSLFLYLFFVGKLILFVVFLTGLILSLQQYIKNLFVLKKLREESFCQHKINHVYILFNTTAAIPFCWSGVKNHFIIIPEAFLEKNSDLKLVLRHELQHIRQGDTYRKTNR